LPSSPADPGLGCADDAERQAQKRWQEHAMDENGFWKIVQDANDASGGDMERKCVKLRQLISALPRADAIEFAQLFDAMMDKAYSSPLWGAAYLINDGCSDDTFTDFRASLISRGRQAFERAVSDPDSLADEDSSESDWFYEGYEYAANDGVEAAGGKWPQPTTPIELTGADWQEDDLDTMFPKLSAKFG
jgi:hypothetical protein